MALTIDEVRKIATLARLRFSPEEEVALTSQLGRIVDYIDQLQRLDAGAATSAPAAAAPPASLEDRRLSDLPLPSLPREVFLANAPAAQDAFLLVPEIKGGANDEAS
jgi:aspartyl-tRNA(Asn)/glutamyl-tRNA(Gln) amidotransferase subunit C